VSLCDARADRKISRPDSDGSACRTPVGVLFAALLGRTRTLDSHARRLRRKLNEASETAFVLNVWGVGYRLVAAA
jgi:hypothetical protein